MSEERFNDVRGGGHEARATLLGAACWFLSASLGWLAVTLVIVGLRSGWPSVGTLVYLLGASILVALLGSLCLAIPHLAAALLPNRWPRLVGSTLVVVLAAIWPCWKQALFLTAGDAISLHPQAELIRGGLFVFILAGVAGLWLWHLRGTRPRLVEPDPRPGPSRWLGAILWAELGVVALLVLVEAIERRLGAYAFFGAFLAFPTWALASTLAFALLCFVRRVVPLIAILLIGASVCSALFVNFESDGASPGRTTALEGSRLAAVVDLVIDPRERPVSRFDFSDTARFVCGPASFEATRPAPPLPIADKARRNVVLVTVDGLRRDALDWKVGGEGVTPNLRAFREQSVSYDKAVTTYPATLYALGGALTGLGPSDILFAPTLPRNILTRTRDVFDEQIVVVPRVIWFEMPIVEALFFQGTETEAVNDAAVQTELFVEGLDEARQQGRSVLAWIHYYEAHPPWVVHPDSSFGSSYRERYMSEIAYVDSHFGRLMQFLADDGWLDDTVILVFADHGESIGENDYNGHHIYLSSALTDIPMMLYAPGLTPRRSAEMVAITDVAATVLHVAGLDLPREPTSISLFEPPSERANRLVVAEAFPLRGREQFAFAAERIRDAPGLEERLDRINQAAVSYEPKVAIIDADHRLIVNRSSGLVSLFDRRTDPAEEENLASREPELREELEGRLRRWHEEQSERIYCRVLNAAR